MGQEEMTYPLLPYSQIVYEDRKRDPTAHVHSWTIRWMTEQINAKRLRPAIEEVLLSHGVFLMDIDEHGRQYRTSPTDVLVGKYHEFRIDETENEVQLTISLNRILGDETSKVILFQEIARAYNGEDVEDDVYWEWLQEYEKHKLTARYMENRIRLEQMFKFVDYPLSPQPDKNEGQGVEDGLIAFDLNDYEGRLNESKEKRLLSLNGLMVLATEMAIMDMEGTDKAGLTWAYNGRETIQEQRIYGSLHRDVPICLERDELPKMIRQTRNRLREGIRLSDYPYTLTAPADSPWHKAVNVLVQPDLGSIKDLFPKYASLLDNGEVGHVHLDVEIFKHPLRMQLRYNPTCYSEKKIQQFGEQIKKNIRKLLGL